MFFAPVRDANDGRPVLSQSCIACFASEKIVLSMEQSIREKRASSGQISMRLPEQLPGLGKDEEPARHEETRREVRDSPDKAEGGEPLRRQDAKGEGVSLPENPTRRRLPCHTLEGHLRARSSAEQPLPTSFPLAAWRLAENFSGYSLAPMQKGMKTSKVLPTPTSLFTTIRPWWASTTDFAIARPSPVPSAFPWLTKGSKIAASRS